jgi:hypothetical protein
MFVPLNMPLLGALEQLQGENGSSCLLHNTFNQSLNSRPKPAFFRGAHTAIGNSWGRSKVNLLHRGAAIKIVDFSNLTKRPLWPSFGFKMRQVPNGVNDCKRDRQNQFFEPPPSPVLALSFPQIYAFSDKRRVRFRICDSSDILKRFVGFFNSFNAFLFFGEGGFYFF